MLCPVRPRARQTTILQNGGRGGVGPAARAGSLRKFPEILTVCRGSLAVVRDVNSTLRLPPRAEAADRPEACSHSEQIPKTACAAACHVESRRVGTESKLAGIYSAAAASPLGITRSGLLGASVRLECQRLSRCGSLEQSHERQEVLALFCVHWRLPRSLRLLRVAAASLDRCRRRQRRLETGRSCHRSCAVLHLRSLRSFLERIGLALSRRGTNARQARGGCAASSEIVAAGLDRIHTRRSCRSAVMKMTGMRAVRGSRLFVGRLEARRPIVDAEVATGECSIVENAESGCARSTQRRRRTVGAANGEH